MLIKRTERNPVKSYEITPESVYRGRHDLIGRRQLLKGGAATALLAGVGSSNVHAKPEWHDAVARPAPHKPKPKDKLTPMETATKYNNFYEFGTGKADPKNKAQDLVTDPWRIRVDGAVDKPGNYWLDDLIKGKAIQERIYRLRCVEAWSMVIPWVGIPLADLIKPLGPSSKAKYVRFETLHDPEQMPGQRDPFATIKWPYVEGLRMDEAMHPLTLMAVGMYNTVMPPQNGAPIRLVVPWKYGFKSIKSIVRISFVETMPKTSWNLLQPSEYGFYANVNPEVDHPRWSQSRERRLPNTLFNPNWKKTLMFNGYGEEVAGLYQGMNLRKFF